MSMRPLHVFLVWLLFGALQGLLTLVSRALPAREAAWALPVGLLFGLAWAAFTPAIAWYARRIRASSLGTVAAIAAHALAALAVAGAAAVARWVFLSILAPTPPQLALTFLYWLDLHVVLYLTVAGLARTLDLRREVRDRSRQTLELQAQLARARLQFLQRQLQPHFLFNALNAVVELAHEAPEAAERMIRRLQQLLRSAMSRADVDVVALRDELATLEPFIEIQRTRFSDRLVVERRVDARSLEALVPTLLLQPLVENAIQHGLASRDGGRVLITAEVVGGRLRLAVHDNGAGLDQRTIADARRGPRTGIGLRNTRTRLAQLYGDAHRFELDHAPDGGAVVRLEIPFATATPGQEPPMLQTGEHTVPLPAGEELAPASLLETGERVSAELAAPAAVETPIVWRAVSARPPRISAKTWGALAAVWAAFALFWTNQIWLYRVASDVSSAGATTIRPIINWPDILSAGIWAGFTPLVVWLARRFPIGHRNASRRIPLHLAFALVLDATHLTIIQTSGVMGEFSILGPNIVNPFLLNLLIYAALLTWSHGRDFHAWYRERELATHRLEAAIARAQWRMLCVDLRPEWILGTLDAIADRVRRDPDAAERLIARLADVLRGTLESAREPVTTLAREIERLKSYVDILRETGGAAVRLRAAVHPGLEDAGIPSGLLRGLLERQLASEGIARGAAVDITLGADQENGRLRLTVRSTLPFADAGRPPDGGALPQAIAAAALPAPDAGLSIERPDQYTVILRIDAGALPPDVLAAEPQPSDAVALSHR